jgi:CheY-like chemotaxis protein
LRRLIESEISQFPGVQIYEADDGDVAVEMVTESIKYNESYDIILMDNNMKRLNGPEATCTIRKALQFGGIMIGITGDASPRDIRSFKYCGLNEVIIKPVLKAKLFKSFINHIKLDEV